MFTSMSAFFILSNNRIIFDVILVILQLRGSKSEEIIKVENTEKEEVLLLAGGIEETQENGAVVNTQHSAVIIYPSGKSCELEDFVLSFNAGAGFALTDGRSRVAVCLGYKDTRPSQGCQIWRKGKKGTVNATITGDGKEILESRWNEDENAMLYPVYTPCQMTPENCVVFGLNYANDESGSEVMTARLVPDKDEVQINVVSILPGKFPFSSCLVFLQEPANRLFFLG
ncbi:uncharacterized protein LOC111708712, partial [Eurytemora carolleeae]|uniref:uncharacterized protein LOC111708712 n=1 Tax=Eurytemora carolleeae TaxID=1294199 RepID=UPI000C7817D1